MFSLLREHSRPKAILKRPLVAWVERVSRGRGERAVVAFKRHSAPLGLALIVGATLRLIWLGDTSFLGDQAQLLALGQSAADRHALIVTGTINSIGALNLPLSDWPYAPFGLAGGPLAATIFTALGAVAAIGMLYAIATRYGGRRAGFVAALLYATASGPIHYSRFFWEPNLMAPFLLLCLGAILAGVVDRRRGWLGWAALCWGIAIQFHLSAAALAAVLLFSLLIGWRTVSRRDYALAGAALVAIFAPTLLWETVSHGYDLAAYRTLSSSTFGVDVSAPVLYARIIAPAAADVYGPGSTYEMVGAALSSLAWVMAAAALAAGVWVAAISISPWLSGWRVAGGPRAVMASQRWRLAATLFIWQAAPMASLLRRSVGAQEHYLLMLTPVIYLTIGLWAAAATRAIETRLVYGWARGIPATLAALILAIAGAQTTGVSAELYTIHTGRFVGMVWPQQYGIPLSGQQSTLAAATRVAAQKHATLYVATNDMMQDSYAYLAQSGATGATVYASDNCVVMPAPDSARPMVTLALPYTSAIQAAPLLMGAHEVASLQTQGSPPLAVYFAQPGAGPMSETALTAFVGVADPHPTAYGYARDARGQSYLAVRWSGPAKITTPSSRRVSYWFGGTADGPVVANYTITAQAIDSAGRSIGAPLKATCGRLPWRQGVDLLAWIPLPSTPRENVEDWSVSLGAAPAVALRAYAGPLALETGDVHFAEERTIAGPFLIAARQGG